MSETTNTELTEQLRDLVDKWQGRENELIDWLTGRADGGPNGDGKYPLTTRNGDTRYVMCPEAVADMVAGPAEESRQAASEADSHADDAHHFTNQAESHSNRAKDAQEAAENAESRAQRSQEYAESSESNIRTRTRLHFPDTKTVRVPNQTSITSMNDADEGSIGWDNDYLYVKTNHGTKRVPLQSI